MSCSTPMWSRTTPWSFLVNKSHLGSWWRCGCYYEGAVGQWWFLSSRRGSEWAFKLWWHHSPWSSPLLGAEEKGLVDWRTRVRGVTMYSFNPTFQWLSSILSWRCKTDEGFCAESACFVDLKKVYHPEPYIWDYVGSTSGVRFEGSQMYRMNEAGPRMTAKRLGWGLAPPNLKPWSSAGNELSSHSVLAGKSYDRWMSSSISGSSSLVDVEKRLRLTGRLEDHRQSCGHLTNLLCWRRSWATRQSSRFSGQFYLPTLTCNLDLGQRISHRYTGRTEFHWKTSGRD